MSTATADPASRVPSTPECATASVGAEAPVAKPRRWATGTRTRVAGVLAAGLLVVLASGCWRLVDTRSLVLWTTVGVPVQVCNTGLDDDLNWSSEVRFEWGDGEADAAFLAWERWDGHCFWHTYTQPGTYLGQVSMNPGHQTEGTQQLTVTVAPAAGYLRATGTAPSHTSATFTASGLSAFTQIPGEWDPAPVHHWDFGDGTTAATSASMTTHTYATPGTYQVQVTVTRAFDYDLRNMFHEAYAYSVMSVAVGS